MAYKVAELPPLENGNLRFILIHSYSDSSGCLGGRSSGRSTTQDNSNLRLIMIDSYCESSGRPGGRSSAHLPPRKWQFEIHTDRFLLLELMQDRWHIKWHICPPDNGNFRLIMICEGGNNMLSPIYVSFG